MTIDHLRGLRCGAVTFCCDPGQLLVRFLDKTGQIISPIFVNFGQIQKLSTLLSKTTLFSCLSLILLGNILAERRIFLLWKSVHGGMLHSQFGLAGKSLEDLLKK